jgi:uncharacterized protein (TIGR02001 family)
MNKKLITLAVAGALASPLLALAADAAPTPEHTLTGNLTLASSYRFRGIDQTFGEPAIQGGIDYAHSSGLYLGNWNSNVNEGAGFPSGNIEMDFYGGYKFSAGDFGFDVGAIYYYYPGSDSAVGKLGSPQNFRPTDLRTHNGSVDNTEIYLGVSWKFLSAKYYYSVNDYFSTPHTDGSSYFDVSANYDLGDGWGINGHVGYLNFENQLDGDYTDWKIGVTKDINGWVIGLAYIDTNAKGSCSKFETYCFTDGSDPTRTKDAGRGIGVLSVTKAF